MSTVAKARIPSRLDRVWWAIVRSLTCTPGPPSAPGVGEGYDTVGDPTTAGAWSWYPSAGTLRPRRLGVLWTVGGPGAAVAGTVYERDGRIRFVPNRYWSRQGIADWERHVTGERTDGPWRVVATDDGEAVLRRRRTR